MNKYSESKVVEFAHNFLVKLSKEEKYDLAEFLYPEYRKNDLKIRQEIFKVIQRNGLIDNSVRGQNYTLFKINSKGKKIANEIGGLKSYLENQKTPIETEEVLKIDFIKYLIENDKRDILSQTTTYSLFKNVSNERAFNCANFFIKKNIITLVEEGESFELILKPTKAAYRINENPSDIDKIIQVAKHQNSEFEPSDENKISPIIPKAGVNNSIDAPSRKTQRHQLYVAIIIASIAIITLILKIKGVI